MSSKAERANLAIDEKAVLSLLENFIRVETRRAGMQRAVIGLSGGVDSALSAALAVKALGSGNVFCVYMPYKSSALQSRIDAQSVADHLGLKLTLQSITKQVDAYFKEHPEANRLRRGNKMSRERMSILYDLSAEKNALVIGTSNKTELLLGYGTLFGDMASAINPLGDLYKSQVWDLSRAAGLPAAVVDKAPSADLWAGQSDEKELGFGYGEADGLLAQMVDARKSDDDLEDLGFNRKMVQNFRRRVARSQFKRMTPVIAKLGARTLGRDFRYPRDWLTTPPTSRG